MQEKILQVSRLLLLVTLLVSSTQACVIPVFRYALERWQAEPYICTVYCQDSLIGDNAELLDQLKKSSESPLMANMGVLEIRVSQLSDSLKKEVQKDIGGKPLPWIRLHFPMGQYGYSNSVLPDTKLVWEGALSDTAVNRIIQSPIRKEVSRRIKDGESAVWVMLQSGDSKADAEAMTMLKEQLKTLSKDLKLPEIPPSQVPPWFNPNKGPELRVHFSVLTLSRNDPSEQVFVNMLLKQPEASGDTMKGPLFFAMFGQARSLPPFSFEKMTPALMKNVCQFLIGMCSCEVKEMNPGFDMLFATNWYDRPQLSKPVINMKGYQPSDEPQQLTGMTAVPAKKTAQKDTTLGKTCSVPGSSVKKATDSIAKVIFDSSVTAHIDTAPKKAEPYALAADTVIQNTASPKVRTSIWISIITLFAFIAVGSGAVLLKKRTKR